MASTKRRYSKEEFARRGDALYRKMSAPNSRPTTRASLQPSTSKAECYEIDADELKAGNRLATHSRCADLDGAGRLSLGPSLRRSGTAGNAMITGVVKSDEGRIRLQWPKGGRPCFRS